MREPRKVTSTDGYERPQHPWHCGLADEGPPCPLGPSAHGQCPAAAACHPVRDGDRWHCNRSSLRGGPCADGPAPDGACAIVYRCTPVRSLRAIRGRLAFGVAMAALGAACMSLSGPWRNAILAPGPLSMHHARLIAGEPQAMRCAQCHAAGEATISDWWAQSTGTKSLGPSQSTLCIECHGKELSREWATAAHNMDVDELRGMDRGASGVGDDPARPRRRDPAEPIACAACHREHQGLNHNLAAMTNNACQACHRERFDSFAEGHPDFAAWPYERRTRIAFDHGAHQLKHFPAEKQEFSCSMCHQRDATGQRQLTRDYTASCASCHDKAIAMSLADGVSLIALPTLDVEALIAAGQDIGPWPATATGDFDGALPMAAKLLVAADLRGAAAIETLGPTFDFYDVDPENDEQLAATADLAQRVKDLISDLSDDGQAAIATRLQSVLGRELTLSELESLTGRLSPDTAAAYRDQWFANSPGGPEAAEDRAAQRARVFAGGWLRDEATLSLRYQPVGHADPWLRAWLDVLAEAASGPRRAIAEPLLRAALKPTAPGLCGSCHSVERDSAGRLAVQWQPFEPSGAQRGFTRFDHGPHLLQMNDCASCHRIDGEAQRMSSYAGDDPRPFVADFEPMTRAACVECHTASAAGDSCTQCHTYHAETTTQK